MAYGLCIAGGGRLTSAEIIAQLDPAIPIQAAHAQAVRDLEAHGMRYSNHDFDVLAAAHRAIGRTDVQPWERAWVDAMLARAQAA